MNYNLPLPDIYESQMPLGLTSYEQFKWREDKIKELRFNRLVTFDENNVIHYLELEKDAPSDTEQSKTNNETLVTAEVERPMATKTERTIVSKSNYGAKKVVSKKTTSEKDLKVECVHDVPTDVIESLRRMFASSAKKADLVSAAVYIFTNGDCEISEKAMALVDSYSSDDKLVSIEDRIRQLEIVSKRQLQMLQSIELCTCYNAFDRRYGSKEPRTSPDMTEFREEGTLDMLSRLREQAYDQAAVDNQDRGRQIYNQTKDIRR